MTIYNNAVNLKSENIRTTLIKLPEDDKNLILLRSLTKHTEKEPGVTHKLLCNEKIKETTVCLSNDGLISLYQVIHEYLIKNKIKE